MRTPAQWAPAPAQNHELSVVNAESGSIQELYLGGYRLLGGLSVHFMQEIMDKSREPLMLSSVPEDYSRRFTNESAFNRWLRPQSGAKKLYILSDHMAALGGLIWFSTKRQAPRLCRRELPSGREPATTFAIRLYEGFRGAKLGEATLSRVFAQAAHEDLGRANRRREVSSGTWLRVNHHNNSAISLYESIGYRRVGDDASGRQFMVRYFDMDTSQQGDY